jgi:hypothetical protein
MPAHLVNGARAGILVGRYLGQLKPLVRWGVVRASGGEFIVPDWPVLALIPINPTLALANSINETLDRVTVGVVNEELRVASRRYFVARDFAACP